MTESMSLLLSKIARDVEEKEIAELERMFWGPPVGDFGIGYWLKPCDPEPDVVVEAR